ncbi:hypothetical protein [Gemmatimonas sp.]|uniref:hypothetical protein n=1 Tax=Gemmatimonas sp. TaxID=1962908 RepID=UPI003DA28237
MRQPRPRQGSTLVELLVALPLALLAAATAALLLIHVARVARMQSAVLSTTRELRHARLLLTAELEPLDGRDLVVVTDTLLEVRSHLGVLIVCEGRNPANLLVAVPAGTADQWVSTLRVGDDVRGWQPSVAAGEPPVDRTSRLRETPTSVAHAPCLANERAAVPQWRLSLADSTLTLLPGAPVLVRRDTRLQHYRSAGAWWLGRRQRDGALWDGLQPAAGPFASAADGGIRLRAMTSGEMPVAVLAPLADSIAERIAGVELSLRAPRRVPGLGGGRVDSASTLVAFRATASDRRQP